MHSISLVLLDVLSLTLIASVYSASESCRPGAFKEAGSCINCEPGKYSDQVDASSCRLCSSGTASTYQAATSCTNCQPGQYSFRGSTSCSLCSMGTYSSRVKSGRCTECPSGKYAKNLGSTACNSASYCPAGTWASISINVMRPRCSYDPAYKDESE
jgi:hypothetical protein